MRKAVILEQLLLSVSLVCGQEGYEYGPPPVQNQLTLKPRPRPTRPPRPQPVEAVGIGIAKPQPSSSSHSHSDSSDPLAWLRESVPGEPGLDYPIYASPPSTSFSCAGRQPGLYADVEAGCQAWHTCLDTRSWTHLCPNGTVFNQGIFSCVWWFEFDCEEAEQLYVLNDDLYKSETGSSGNKGGGSSDSGFTGGVRPPISQGGSRGQVQSRPGRPGAEGVSSRGPGSGKPNDASPSNGRPSAGKPAVGKPSGGNNSGQRPFGGRLSGGTPLGGKNSAGRPSGERPLDGRPSVGRPSGRRPSNGRPSGVQNTARPVGGGQSKIRPSEGKPSGGSSLNSRPGGGSSHSSRPKGKKSKGKRPIGSNPSGGRAKNSRPRTETASGSGSGRPLGGRNRPKTGEGLVLVLPAVDDLPGYRPDTGYGAPGRRGGRVEDTFGGLFDY